jgi:hypothetical protein
VSAACDTLGAMDTLADVLLIHAVQAWCEECSDEQLLVPAEDDGAAGGLCCTVCDAAVFLVPVPEASGSLRRTA